MSNIHDGGKEIREAARKVNSLAEARIRTGYTQEQVAEKINIEPTTVGRWERGTQEPQPWMRPRLAKVLGISVDELSEIFAEMSRTGEDEAGEAATLLAGEIRRLRKDAGLSQPQLAMRVGYTRQYISLAERPKKNLPSIELIRALDASLNAEGTLMELRERAKTEQRARREKVIRRVVSVAELTDTSPKAETPSAVIELRDVLTDYGFRSSDLGSTRQGEEPPTMHDLKRDLKVTFDAYQQSRFTIAASRVSTLLADAQLAAQEGDRVERGEAFGILALSYQAAASVLIKAGEADLAWIAAERGLNAAENANDPAIRGSLIRSVAFPFCPPGGLNRQCA